MWKKAAGQNGKAGLIRGRKSKETKTYLSSFFPISKAWKEVGHFCFPFLPPKVEEVEEEALLYANGSLLVLSHQSSIF